MSNEADYSYRRYHQYRVNKRRFNTNQIAVPIVMMILIAIVSKFWWLILGIAIIFIIAKYIVPYVVKNKKTESRIQNMDFERSNTMEAKSTDAGYINKNNQKNLGKTNKPGTDNNQWFYQMECQECGNQYYANGTDIWLRKCPKCQGGQS